MPSMAAHADDEIGVASGARASPLRNLKDTKNQNIQDPACDRPTVFPRDGRWSRCYYLIILSDSGWGSIWGGSKWNRSTTRNTICNIIHDRARCQICAAVFNYPKAVAKGGRARLSSQLPFKLGLRPIELFAGGVNIWC